MIVVLLFFLDSSMAEILSPVTVVLFLSLVLQLLLFNLSIPHLRSLMDSVGHDFMFGVRENEMEDEIESGEIYMYTEMEKKYSEMLDGLPIDVVDDCEIDDWMLYLKQTTESEGFNVDRFPGMRGTLIVPMNWSRNKEREHEVKFLTNLAVEDYNKRSAACRILGEPEIVKVNYLICDYIRHYITFKAMDDVGQHVYQAIVDQDDALEESTVTLCRLKPRGRSFNQVSADAPPPTDQRRKADGLLPMTVAQLLQIQDLGGDDSRNVTVVGMIGERHLVNMGRVLGFYLDDGHGRVACSLEVNEGVDASQLQNGECVRVNGDLVRPLEGRQLIASSVSPLLSFAEVFAHQAECNGQDWR